MHRRVSLLAIVSSIVVASFSQNVEQQEYEKLRQQMLGKYNDFRNEANRKYANFLRQSWDEYKKLPAIPKPKEKKLPPVVMPEEERSKPTKDTPIIIDSIIAPPAPQPQPKPIAPIKEQGLLREKIVNFSFYNTACRVRIPLECPFSLLNCDKNSLAEAWERLSEPDYNNTIRDCLTLREQLQLCDWAYINMLKAMSEACLGKTNEATLLSAYIYCQSGYDMRIGIIEGKLCLLFGCRHLIYDMGYFNIEGKRYYPLGSSEASIYVCDASFPEEKSLDLSIHREMSLAYDMTPERNIKSDCYPGMNATICTNRNLVDFYNTYPSSMIDDDFMTRWALYANTPMDIKTKEKLYACLKPELESITAKEAVERLLNFVQTAFVYEFDDKVWGQDRAFFPEETLYYPYCDCEDRSILFSRLVRDLLGLNVVLIYYPGHLATAVHFTDDVSGDYVLVNGTKYIVCDPTYIGAPVGATMPQMDNTTAKIVVLNPV